MVSATGQAIFAVVAKDAATKVLKGVGRSFGGVKSAGEKALGALKVAAVGAAAALAAMGIAAVNAAIQDERDTARLNAALRARGILTDDLRAKIDAQTQAMAALGFTDDDVRAGIETGSRFFKKQSDLLKVNSIAADIAAVSGKSLSEVVMAIGRGANGSTRGLTSLGIKVKSGAKLQEILTKASAKYNGTAKEIANTTAGKFAKVQITLNEAFEKMGYEFLPLVNDALDFFATSVLPAVQTALREVRPAFQKILDAIKPFATAVAELATTLWDNGKGPLAIALAGIGAAFEIAAGFAKGFFSVLYDIVKIVNELLKLLAALGDALRNSPNIIGSSVRLPGANYVGGGTMANPNGTAIFFDIGTDKQDKLVGGTLARNAGKSRVK